MSRSMCNDGIEADYFDRLLRVQSALFERGLSPNVRRGVPDKQAAFVQLVVL